jgi:hypothetical protein
MAKKNGGIVKKGSKTVDRARNPQKGFDESTHGRPKTIKVSRDEPWPPPPPKGRK